MPKPYSVDFRGRVVDEIASGASRREAAAHYGISPSVVVNRCGDAQTQDCWQPHCGLAFLQTAQHQL
jgi:transposase